MNKPMKALTVYAMLTLALLLCGTTSFAQRQFTLCQPVETVSFTGRIHVRCATPVNGTILFFACSTEDPHFASRMLNVGMAAEVAQKNLVILFDPNDLSGADFGCLAKDCRIALAIGITESTTTIPPPTPTPTPTPIDNAAITAALPAPHPAQGKTTEFHVQVTARNTGITDWTPTSGYGLSAAGIKMQVKSVSSLTATVSPGLTATFDVVASCQTDDTKAGSLILQMHKGGGVVFPEKATPIVCTAPHHPDP